MDKATFEAFAAELAIRVARDYPGTALFLGIFPPGSFSAQAQPLTASTLPEGLEPRALRALAANYEERDTSVISVVKL